ncbi:MAG: hypothetical protein P8X94_06290, partial [Woeseiaceae bacterium]
MHGQFPGPQVGRAQFRRHEFTECHDADADPHADLPDETHAGDELLQFVQPLGQQGITVQPEIIGKLQVLRADSLKLRSRVPGDGTVEHVNQRVRYATQRRVHDDRPQAGVEARADQLRDPVPVPRCRYTAAAELHDDPGGAGDPLGRAQRQRVAEF